MLNPTEAPTTAAPTTVPPTTAEPTTTPDSEIVPSSDSNQETESTAEGG